MDSSSMFKSAHDFDGKKTATLKANMTAKLVIGTESILGECDAQLVFLPKPRTNIKIVMNNVDQNTMFFISYFCDSNSIELYIEDEQVEGFITSTDTNNELAQLIVNWCPRFDPTSISNRTEKHIETVMFHMFNQKSIRGERAIRNDGENTVGFDQVLDIKNHEWHIEICERHLSDDEKSLIKEGGYVLTHIGKIRKIDKQEFSGEEVTELLYLLRFAFSFSMGYWCEFVSPVGFNRSGERVWESWSSPSEEVRGAYRWFNTDNGMDFSEFFVEFSKLWANSTQQDSLREVIYWYLEANTSRIDVGIIVTQAAIERLAFEYLVKEKKLISKNKFSVLRASEIFRKLFSSLKIPIEIPAHLKTINEISHSNWIDSAHALTEIKNSLVHPDNKSRGKLTETYYEAWHLGLWYLEMGILALCKYNGKYLNRLKHSGGASREHVPW